MEMFYELDKLNIKIYYAVRQEIFAFRSNYKQAQVNPQDYIINIFFFQKTHKKIK